MHASILLHWTDHVGPVIGGLVFVVVMSLLREPLRRNFNAVLVAGSCGTYLCGGGFGAWELVYPVLAIGVVTLGLRSYRFIGIAWLMHACWDLVHHLYGNSIWPFMPTSSWGCMLFDSVIGAWFLAGAPSVFESFRRTGVGRKIAAGRQGRASKSSPLLRA